MNHLTKKAWLFLARLTCSKDGSANSFKEELQARHHVLGHHASSVLELSELPFVCFSPPFCFSS